MPLLILDYERPTSVLSKHSCSFWWSYCSILGCPVKRPNIKGVRIPPFLRNWAIVSKDLSKASLIQQLVRYWILSTIIQRAWKRILPSLNLEITMAGSNATCSFSWETLNLRLYISSPRFLIHRTHKITHVWCFKLLNCGQFVVQQ